MCFSATASFAAAAGLTLAGLACQRLVPDPAGRLLAAFPLFFAVQQSLEGLIWLQLGQGLSPDSLLVKAYLSFALVFWPLITPLAVLLTEAPSWRRPALLVFQGLGVALAAYLVLVIATTGYTAEVRDHNIAYVSGREYPLALQLLYVVPACLSLLIASRRLIQLFGAIIAVAAIVAYLGFPAGRPSVWCFFAALASLTLVAHFWQQRRRTLI